MSNKRLIDGPNLIETIEKALSQKCLTIGQSANLIPWLRALLEERKTHAPHGRNYTNEQYVALRLELEQVKSERDAYRLGLSDVADYQHRWSDKPIFEVQKIARSVLSNYPPRREEDEK